MKKLIILIVLGTMSSCTKEYICECTLTLNPGPTQTLHTNQTIVKGSKAEAIDKCADNEFDYSSQGGNKKECFLK